MHMYVIQLIITGMPLLYMFNPYSVTTNNEKELFTTEGTVFVHVTFAIKQDTQLRKEYLKMLKVLCVYIFIPTPWHTRSW